jgi:nucleoside-diphosphate-sugar epimerase
MKIILLTGASGFIGRHTIPFLIDRGYEIHAVYHTHPPEFIQNKNLILHRCNLLDFEEQEKLLSEIKPTHLLHFAWYTVHREYWTSFENIKWVQASLNLFLNFAKNGGRRAVVAGTCAEYDWNYGFFSEGITPTNPKTLYGICKDSLHRILSHFCRQANISLAWGRIFFVYGPYENPQRLIPYVITSLLEDKPAFCSHGNQIRDFLYVEDAASAFVSLLESDVQGPINIASGQPISLKTIIYKIADFLGKRYLINLGAVSTSDDEVPFLVADIRRLKNEVRWEPKFTIDEGLNISIEWWKNKIRESKIKD